MKKIVLVSLLLTAFLTTSYSQNAEKRWAVGAYVNWADFNFPKMSFSDQLTHMNWQGMNGEFLPSMFSLGYYINPSFTVEASAAWLHLETEKFKTIMGKELDSKKFFTCDLSLQYKLANGYILKEGTKMDPYVYLGFGFTAMDEGKFIHDMPFHKWTTGVGLNYWMCKNFALNFHANYAAQSDYTDFMHYALGVKFRFSGKCGKGKVAEVPQPLPKQTISRADQEAIISIAKAVYFDTGSDKIKAESLPRLDELVTIVKKYPGLKITVEGHTDNVGSAESNQKLSQDRVNSVKNYLTTKGIESNRITATGYGETKPIATNDTPEGRAQNRRVEIRAEY
jgi:outer membrane protein OmpA-like peptidoglycan-associated protein